MKADIQEIKRLLKEHNFRKIFKNELGWNQRSEAAYVVTYKNQDYSFTYLADKAGFKIYQHTFQTRIPNEQMLKQLDMRLNTAAEEHLTIFADAKQENQAWLWVKRAVNQPPVIRLNRLNKNQSGELLSQKIARLFVSVDDEESITLTRVLDRVNLGFDVEKVTTKFYKLFQEKHAYFLEHIENMADEDDRKWYTSIMLNRLMFVYFLQRKGLLDNTSSINLEGDQLYLQKRLKDIQKDPESDTFYEFYRYFLRRLFHEGLNLPEIERLPDFDKKVGKIPYINGGLFDVHALEKQYPDIRIKDEVFKKIFEFFEEFDWHLDDRPMRNDKEINPDVLGYIFEKYINQKQMGAYYTKEDITGYISKNTIIPFLFTKVAEQFPEDFVVNGTIWSLLKMKPDEYIYEELAHGRLEPLPPEIEAGVTDFAQRGSWNVQAGEQYEQYALPTETWREVVERRRHYDEVQKRLADGKVNTINDLITYNLNITRFAEDVIASCQKPKLLQAFYDAIEQVTVLDPTCGSGAFLFAALNVLRPLYQACIKCMKEAHDQQARLSASQRKELPFKKILDSLDDHRNQEYFILKSIIINNLYGVDIMEEAVEICRLRLFLKLVAQIEKPNDLEPLPDIDFNVLSGNTLIGFTSMKEISRVTEKLFNVGDTEKTLAQIKFEIGEIERDERAFRSLQTKQNMVIDATSLSEHKQRLREKLKNLRTKLDPYLATDYFITEEKYPGTYESVYEQWHKSHKPFHWWVEFHEIMYSGGFDVIIGNPPWKEYSAVRKAYTVQNFATERSGNLYGICIERSLNLRSAAGFLSFIVQLPLVNSSRMVVVRNLLRDKSSSIFTATFDDRPSKLFEGLQNCRSTIFISQAKGDTHTPISATTIYQRWTSDVRENIFPLLKYTGIPEKRIYSDQFPKYASNLEVSLFEKVQTAQKYKAGLAIRQRSNEHFIFYQEATRYWIKATAGLPFYAHNGEIGAPPHGRFLYFENAEAVYAMCSILNSSLFYVYFIAFGDCFHLSDKLVSEFPLPAHLLEDGQLIALGKKLMASLKASAEKKTIRTKDGREISYDNYYGSRSKPIIDEIDRILAQHYGFTPEELGFIINYDIKYRMGRDNGEESEE